MSLRLSVLTLVLTLAATSGCSREADTPPKPQAPAAQPVATTQPAEPVPTTATMDPCKLLDIDAVRRVAADAGGPVRDTGDDSVGVRTCAWGSGASAVVLQLFDAHAGAAVTEIRMRSFSLVDLGSPKAGTAVRLEAFPDIGDAAIGYVERVDASRGTRSAGASVLVQVGFRVAVVRAPTLAALPRDEALARLKVLAADIARGLAG